MVELILRQIDLKGLDPSRSNKYVDVAHTLIDRINKRIYTDRLPGKRVLATEFSVSPITIAKALDILQYSGAIHIQPGKGTFVSATKRERKHTLGIIVDAGTEAPLHAELIGGLQSEAAEWGQHLLVRSHRASEKLEMEYIREMVIEDRVDGFIIWPASLSIDAGLDRAVKYLEDQQIPFVIVPEPQPTLYRTCHTVSSSATKVAAEVVQHMVEQGFEDIVFVAENEGQWNMEYCRNRYLQYVQVIEQAGLGVVAPVLLNLNVADAGEKLDSETFSKICNHRAAFCVTDRVAVQVLGRCVREGVRIPHDLALAGYDNTSMASDLGFTSVEQNFRLIGEKAIRLLLSVIDAEEKVPTHESVESKLIVRGSTKSS